MPPDERSPLVPGHLEIIPFTGQYLDEAVDLYSEVFRHDEPTTRIIAPDPGLLRSVAEPYARFLIGKNLSFLARDNRTGSVAGFIFCLDLAETPGSAGGWMTRVGEVFPEAIAMIDQLEKQYIRPGSIPPGTVLHIFQIGIGREYQGRGAARQLIFTALGNARDRGFRTALADCTSERSYSLFRKCGFDEAAYLSYREFTVNGRHFFWRTGRRNSSRGTGFVRPAPLFHQGTGGP